MRGFKSTVALLIVLGGLGAYIYFVASKAEDTGSKNEKMFPGVIADSIEELSVRSESNETTSLKKQDTKWTMTAPVAARASDMDASAITSGIAGLEIIRVVEENPTDVKDYGLDKPQIEVTFKSADGKPSGTLAIGAKTATGATLYARKNDEKRVVLIGEFNEATFNKGTFDLRDKAIMTVDRDKVDGVDVVQGATGFELVKKGADWAMTRPIAARADTSAADGLVSSVAGAQMKSVVSAAPTADELKTYGLDKPVSIVNLHLGSARASMAIGGAAGADTVYAKDVSRPDVYTIQKAVGDDFAKPADDYRRHDMFDMRAFTATRIEITRAGKTTAFEKVKGTGENAQDTWKRVSPAGPDPDKEKFGAFVASIADIRAISFVDAKTKTGLDSPSATIVVKFDEGKKEDKVLLGKNGADAFASRPDDPGAAKIDPTKFDDAIKSIDEFTK
jgi:hypothetical protein